MLSIHITTYLTFFLLTPLVISIPCNQHQSSASPKHKAHNANHIFNAIHSSMRQWGSSWNHNGMSLWLATVPADVELYHGNRESIAIKGIEWLAFEPEHSLQFSGGPPPPPGGPGRHGPGSRPPPSHDQNPLHTSENDDPPPPHFFPPFDDGRPGYLHVFRTKHPLSLLYIDGISAGKSALGTLDTQNLLLLNWTADNPQSPDNQNRGNAMFAEGERAAQLCAMAANQWQGRIDGFIRMELGFEIILCDFEKHLEPTQVLQSKLRKDVPKDSPAWDSMFAWYRGTEARFDGIGGNRVSLNYDRFVTAYAHKLDVFPNGKDSVPRLNKLSVQQLDRLRSAVDDMVLKSTDDSHAQKQNWQAVTDLIVTRYAKAIPYFVEHTNMTLLQGNIEMLMRPFIDYSSRDLANEVDRCTTHFFPPVNSARVETKAIPNSIQSLAEGAVLSISHRICSTLLSALFLPKTTSPAITQTAFQELQEYLDWTVWRKCTRVCEFDEICYMPIWPLGTVEEREEGQGKCMNAVSMHEREGKSYWGMPEFPPGVGGPL